MKLYNYFLQKNVFQEILFKNDIDNIDIKKRIKNQLYIIFQPFKIFGIYFDYHKENDISEEFINKEVNKYFIKKYNKRINNKIILQTYKELLNTLLSPILNYSEYNSDEFDDLINNENNIFSTDNGDNKNNKNDIKNSDILYDYLNGNQNNINNKNINIIKENRKVQNNNYRILFFDLINDIYNSNSNIDQYNLISTILFPLLFLFNDAYEKDNSLNIMNKQILSFLPFINNYNDNLSEISLDLILLNNISINNENNVFVKLIDSKIFDFELYTKKYVISSYLFEIIINVFSVLNIDKLFDLEQVINDIKKENIENKENIHLNKYFYKFQNILSLLSDDYYAIIIKTINILIPFLKELIKNNFYLFFPISIINGISFFIQLIFKYYSIYNKKNLFLKIII